MSKAAKDLARLVEDQLALAQALLKMGKVVIIGASSCPHCASLFSNPHFRHVFSHKHPNAVVLDIDNADDRSLAFAVFTGTSLEEHEMWLAGTRKAVKTPMFAFLSPFKFEAFIMAPQDHPELYLKLASRIQRQVIIPEKPRTRKERREKYGKA